MIKYNNCLSQILELEAAFEKTLGDMELKVQVQQQIVARPVRL